MTAPTGPRPVPDTREREAIRDQAAGVVAEAMEAFKVADTFDGYVAVLPETFATLDAKLVEAVGRIAIGLHQGDHDALNKAMELVSGVRSSLEYAVRLPLVDAGVLPEEE